MHEELVNNHQIPVFEIPGSGFREKLQIFHRVKYITGQYVGFIGLLATARLNCSLQICSLL